jgi:hypothetical protein
MEVKSEASILIYQDVYKKVATRIDPLRQLECLEITNHFFPERHNNEFCYPNRKVSFFL